MKARAKTLPKPGPFCDQPGCKAEAVFLTMSNRKCIRRRCNACRNKP